MGAELETSYVRVTPFSPAVVYCVQVLFRRAHGVSVPARGVRSIDELVTTITDYWHDKDADRLNERDREQ